MADIRNTIAGANYEKFRLNTSDTGQEYIIRVRGSNLRYADLLAIYRRLIGNSGDGSGTDVNGIDGGNWSAFGTADGSVFTSGSTYDEVYVRLQMNGTPNTNRIRIGGRNVRMNIVSILKQVI